MNTSPSKHHIGAALWVAAALTGTALWTRHRAQQAEQHHPPSGKFIDVDGVRLHYLDHGAGPPVLLLHGNGAQATDFMGCGLVNALRTRYRLIAFDRPGFGYSERPRDRVWSPQAQAELLAQACQALGIREPIVVAHSFATEVALALAIQRDLPLRGLVLISGYYFPTLRLDALMLSPPAIPVLGDLMRYTVSPLVGKLMMRRLKRKVFSPKPTDPHFSAAVPTPMMLRPWQLKASAEDSAFMMSGARHLSRFYKDIDIPVEIFAGSGDKIVKQAKQSARLQACIANSRLHVIEGEGHMLHYGPGNQIVEAIDRLAKSADERLPDGVAAPAAASASEQASGRTPPPSPSASQVA